MTGISAVCESVGFKQTAGGISICGMTTTDRLQVVASVTISGPAGTVTVAVTLTKE